jgi:PEP-CTERM motif
MLRKLLVSVAALSLAGPAAAATFTITPGATALIPASNDFQSQLGALGFDSYTYTGATLNVVAAAGEFWGIEFFYYGNENGATATFTGGTATKSYVGGPTSVGAVWTPSNGQQLSGMLTGVGAMSLTNIAALSFATASSGGQGAKVGDYGFALFTGPNKRLSGVNTIWFGYDDNKLIDDNHDDGVFRAVISAVPEASTWGMMIGGMGIAGVALRRRRRDNVAAIV